MTHPPPTVFELRQYTLHPGRRDELIELFEREFIEPQEALGITLAGLFRDAEDPDRFVWIRGFGDMIARKAALEAFYGGPVWRAHRDAANATMIDSDNVLLLRAASDSSFTGESTRIDGRFFCATYDGGRSLEALARELSRQGARIVAAFVTDPSPNTFAPLPVREREDLFVILVDRIDREALAATQSAEIVELVPTARSAIRFAAPGARMRCSTAWSVSTKLRMRRVHRARASGISISPGGAGRSIGRILGAERCSRPYTADSTTSASARSTETTARTASRGKRIGSWRSHAAPGYCSVPSVA